ncbi:hypothetical protein Ancab_026699 [Ancistrocladus abbreviatus]
MIKKFIPNIRWFMPVNVGLTFLFGGILGWIAVKLLKPAPELEGLVIAACSSGNLLLLNPKLPSLRYTCRYCKLEFLQIPFLIHRVGNLGNLVLIIVPAICHENGSPFGDHKVCGSIGLSYASFSMALGGFYLWTYTYQLIRSTAMKSKELEAAERAAMKPNDEIDPSGKAPLLGRGTQEYLSIVVPSSKHTENYTESRIATAVIVRRENNSCWSKLLEVLHQALQELLAPPTVAAILGLMFGAITWLKGLIIGDNAPLRVIQDCIKLLGDGTIPCITLIMGGNLTQGLRSRKMTPIILTWIICIKYLLLPVIGVGVVRVARNLGFLPSEPLYHFVLMLQFTLPPAMNIGTMTQLFDVGQDECSVLFLWTYLFAAIALTRPSCSCKGVEMTARELNVCTSGCCLIPVFSSRTHLGLPR